MINGRAKILWNNECLPSDVETESRSSKIFIFHYDAVASFTIFPVRYS